MHLWDPVYNRAMEVPGQLGYLLLNEEGAVLSSAGELENDEKTADIIMGLLTLASTVDPTVFPVRSFKTLSLTYDQHCYMVCLSNRKIHIVKKSLNIPTSTNELTVNI
ncbi:hypothetical protein QE152_g7469 [Popillia japonica]|uniref:Late endosomal/lysosomal adaptor and MAPK and MTOR activator 4 n=1 Tax=Popillia japonica TaxID=7064 RepID=A0AAW1MB42_POPJA